MKTRIAFTLSASVLALTACQAGGDADLEPAIAPAPPVAEAPAEAPDPVIEAEADSGFDGAALQAVLDAQPEEVQARYDARHPAETIEFFGVEPGMTIVEAFPGGGWYTKILLPYLGPDGALIGSHYPDDIWPRFGFFDEETIARRIAQREGWLETAADWGVENAATLTSTIVTEQPAELDGTVDAVIFIRALHNLNRFDAEAGYMAATLENTFRVLKPGGVVGVVQHQAPDANPDEWANGDAGYLKKDAVVAAFEAAGFVLEAESDINANPADQPTPEEFVWRLPPVLNGSEEGTPEREAALAIGESNRMTLRFRKPG